MPPLARLRRLLISLLTSFSLGLVSFPLVVTAFHPFDGPLQAFSNASDFERYLALVLAIIVGTAIFWRMQRGSAPNEEIRKASDAFSDRGES
jgi:hypothetical protein